MRSSIVWTAAAALLMGGALASAGEGSKAKADPATFTEHAAQAGMTEVELGKIAQTKGKSADVKAFGAQMVKDHGKANMELASIAKPKGLTVPTKLDAKHQAMVDELSAKSGAEFDAAYAEHMAMDHDKAVDLFTSASQSSDKDLAAFAKKTLPTIKEHKKMAEALTGKTSVASK
jgi:putative membrane protein